MAACGAACRRLTVAARTGDLLASGWRGRRLDCARHLPRYTDEFRDLAARGERNGEACSPSSSRRPGHLQLDDWRGAESHYLRALQLDSAFAQAAWELALVRRWRERSFEAEWRRLYEQRARLTELQQLGIISAQLKADLPTRFGALEAIARRYPHNAEGLLIEADEVYIGDRSALVAGRALRVWDLASRRQAYSTAVRSPGGGRHSAGSPRPCQRALGALRRGRAAAEGGHERAGLSIPAV